MLSFGNTLCAAQRLAWPKSSFPFYEKLSTYVSPMVSGLALPQNYVIIDQGYLWHGKLEEKISGIMTKLK